jgi:3-methyl-2-oxobutanoate hydroxymethyltransferase
VVLHDMLGMTETAPKFVQNFMEGAPSIQAALKAFVDAVKSGDYPKEEHTYS